MTNSEDLSNLMSVRIYFVNMPLRGLDSLGKLSVILSKEESFSDFLLPSCMPSPF